MSFETIDLHSHTSASDGALTPTQLVKLAKDSGLKALAVTDHDTLEGLPEAINAGNEIGIEVVPGIEISAEFGKTMHLLGYYMDPADEEANRKLKELQDARKTRNPKIITKLNQLGLDITMEEVETVAGPGQVGRPHFAKVLIDKAYVNSFNEAFDRYLTKGGPAYVNKFRFSPQKAIEMILQAGGLPVLAHPFTLGLEDDSALKDLISQLAGYGLAGLEVFYSDYSPEMSRKYLELTEEFDLAPTGGSDFHGNNKPEIKLGCGKGDLMVPYEILNGLKKRLKRNSAHGS